MDNTDIATKILFENHLFLEAMSCFEEIIYDGCRFVPVVDIDVFVSMRDLAISVA